MAYWGLRAKDAFLWFLIWIIPYNYGRLVRLTERRMALSLRLRLLRPSSPEERLANIERRLANKGAG